MNTPTIGQMFASFGEDVAAHDGQAAADGARSAAARAEEASRVRKVFIVVTDLNDASTAASWRAAGSRNPS